MKSSASKMHLNTCGFRSHFFDRIQFKCRPLVQPFSSCRNLPRLSTISMQFEDSDTAKSSSEAKPTPWYVEDKQKKNSGAMKSYSAAEQTNGNVRMDEPSSAESMVPQKRAAKIHDFCFGIPFGGLVLSGGLVEFLVSRNPKTLTSGVLYGGSLLALSSLSLKIWRKGQSSLPFILAQAALSVAFLVKQFQAYCATRNIFPSGFYTVLSAAMLCFYSYVMLSGGNPPPKKLKAASISHY